MAQLGLGLTANQNSIPRELVYDVNAMLDGQPRHRPLPLHRRQRARGPPGPERRGHEPRLHAVQAQDRLPPPPDPLGLQRRPPADRRQVRRPRGPAGRRLPARELHHLRPLPRAGLDHRAGGAAAGRSAARPRRGARSASGRGWPRPGSRVDEDAFAELWPRSGRRCRRCSGGTTSTARRASRAFTTAVGRAYLRELSIDELPGLTTPETTAIMLALCEALGMAIHFVAPAFGFQKNCPSPTTRPCAPLIARQWAVCAQFGASIGFHSGSGKSAENYQVMGDVTGGRLEIKTSGRYTYEMGRALSASTRPRRPGALARLVPLHARTRARSAPSAPTRPSARWPGSSSPMRSPKAGPAGRRLRVAAACRRGARGPARQPRAHVLGSSTTSSSSLPAGGRAEKAALGDHGPAGYASGPASTRSAGGPAAITRRRRPATSCSSPRRPGWRAPSVAAARAARRLRAASATARRHLESDP